MCEELDQSEQHSCSLIEHHIAIRIVKLWENTSCEHPVIDASNVAQPLCATPPASQRNNHRPYKLTHQRLRALEDDRTSFPKCAGTAPRQ